VIGSLRIDANDLAQRFRRDTHPVDELLDGNKSYFGEIERLTAAELIEIESWPSTVRELFELKESADAKVQFLRCLRGVAGPKTSTEKIVTKRIHQALAMGGLHCQTDYIKSANPQFPSDQPLNDIADLIALPLRSFLERTLNEMAEHLNKKWQVAIWQRANDDNRFADDENYQIDLNEGYEEMQQFEAEIRQELHTDAENYASSDEEGWFYSDEDDPTDH